MSSDKHNRTIVNKPAEKVKKSEKEVAEDMTTFFQKVNAPPGVEFLSAPPRLAWI